jgi:shikimate dehydrogenase
MHAAALNDMSIEGEYLGLRVPADEFQECLIHLTSMGFTGVNLTIPHKEAGADVSAGDRDVLETGAANTLKLETSGTKSRNTDIAGFLAPINNAKGTALVLGAGGAAKAAVLALTRTGWKVRIWNRSQDRAVAIAQRTSAEVLEDPSPSACTLIVNATPLGLIGGEQPPLLWEQLEPEATVYDMVYKSEPTAFLAQARNLGAKCIDGREMLVEQGALALEWWTGKRPRREPMREAVGL